MHVCMYACVHVCMCACVYVFVVKFYALCRDIVTCPRLSGLS